MRIQLRETVLYTRSPSFWSNLILIIVSFAFLLSDWVILYMSFGDFILAFALFLLLCLGKIKLTNKQISMVIAILFIVLISCALNYIFNNYWFNTGRAFLSFVKFSFYLTATVLIYNFIMKEKLKGNFLKISNIFAVVAVLIGIFITFLIYSGQEELYQFIWSFTRTDARSYYFLGNEEIVRTRSLFSEPAHLGYYLNIIFYANVFSREKKSNFVILIILAIGILLTLSYSMIFIFFITGVFYLINEFFKGNINWSHKYWFFIIPILLIIFFMRDFLYVTLIERSINILAGNDGSAYTRLVESWKYVEQERLLFGNGIGHTPPVTNIYAYILSEFGLIGFIPFVLFNLSILFDYLPTFILFFTMNFSKGGYLNPMFWLFLLYIFLYGVSLDNIKKLSPWKD